MYRIMCRRTNGDVFQAFIWMRSNPWAGIARAEREAAYHGESIAEFWYEEI